MTLLLVPPGGKKDRSYAQISLLAAIPAILVAAPLVGFFIGRWADQKLGTEPYLVIGGIVLGFFAAGREIYRLVKKSEELDKDDRDG
ncbi:MAG: AtpZ/AtpI family protein [Candidatus Zixiibacteriota bacterium]